MLGHLDLPCFDDAANHNLSILSMENEPRAYVRLFLTADWDCALSQIMHLTLEMGWDTETETETG